MKPAGVKRAGARPRHLSALNFRARQLQSFPKRMKQLYGLWLYAVTLIAIGMELLGLLIMIVWLSHLRRWIQNQLKPIPAKLRSMARSAPQIHFKSQPKSVLSDPSDPTFSSSLREIMRGRNLTVIANREPYIHLHRKNTETGEISVEVTRPASGLVTALEPILRQCGGLWIAHGGGSADRETANTEGEVAVPPDSPRYTLKRVWLTQEQELGYYYGFANEGMWPLCHLAHNRPIFRLSDWEQYKTVNQLFTQSIPHHALNENSLILVQDYHFALVPRMIKNREEGSNARVGLFWHIPWPNPETFGICPWQEDLLRGMLGADVIGFHTQYHCNNFLETCNRYLEARIDWERFSVTMDNRETLIRAIPIGIDTPPVKFLSDEEITSFKSRYGIQARFVAIGVDRLDYTKGLVERVEAVERFLEKNPQYIGQFSLVQVGSPSRTHIPAYRILAETLEAVVQRVNRRFGDAKKDGYLPVIFIPHHHEWDSIQYFYQIGDLCMVTSLHDGMNLVAKEYVWCQRPDRGSLILSKFTGASRELTEAFIVNPYSIEEMADAIAEALLLTQEERFRRMSLMRERVQARNAYHWASDLVRALIPLNRGREKNGEGDRPRFRRSGADRSNKSKSIKERAASL